MDGIESTAAERQRGDGQDSRASLLHLVVMLAFYSVLCFWRVRRLQNKEINNSTK